MINTLATARYITLCETAANNVVRDFHATPEADRVDPVFDFGEELNDLTSDPNSEFHHDDPVLWSIMDMFAASVRTRTPSYWL